MHVMFVHDNQMADSGIYRSQIYDAPWPAQEWKERKIKIVGEVKQWAPMSVARKEVVAE
jgi:hypothetical protein